MTLSAMRPSFAVDLPPADPLRVPRVSKVGCDYHRPGFAWLRAGKRKCSNPDCEDRRPSWLHKISGLCMACEIRVRKAKPAAPDNEPEDPEIAARIRAAHEARRAAEDACAMIQRREREDA